MKAKLTLTLMLLCFLVGAAYAGDWTIGPGWSFDGAFGYTSSYTMDVIITSPANTTYTSSSIAVVLTYSGNETGVTYEWNVHLSTGAWLYVSNQTASSATFVVPMNGTHTFYVTAAGDNGASDAENVKFTTALPSSEVLPAVSVSWLWQYLFAGDIIGFFGAMLAVAFSSLDIAVAVISMIFLVPLYLRTRSLILISVAWILLGSSIIVAMQVASGVAVLFMSLGIAGLLYRLFRPSQG